MIDERTSSTDVGRSKLYWSSLAVAAIALPLFYVVSSGPMLMLGVRHNFTTSTDALGRVVAIDYVDASVWWHNTYAPLIWVSEQSWGEPLQWYWEQSGPS